jgi:hypothetical protein
MRTTAQDVHKCNKKKCLACTQQLPQQIEEILSPSNVEDYGHRENVEIVEPESQSLVSGLTGVLGEWSWLGRKKPEIHIQEYERQEQSMEGLFEDEPRSVIFIRVDEGSQRLGVKRKIMDGTGYIRNELEM